MSQLMMIIYSTFSLYFLFIGFLKMRVAYNVAQWNIGDLKFDPLLIFDFTNLLTCSIFVTFLVINLKLKLKRNGYKNKKTLD